MKSLNLKNVKKVSSDKDKSTFQLENGHQLIIAHKALSPKLKKDLDGLPMAKGGKIQKFADQGDIQDEAPVDVPASKLESQYVPEEAAAQENADPTNPASTPDPYLQAPQSQEPQAPEDTGTVVSPQSAPQDANDVVQQQANPTQPVSPQQKTIDTKQELSAEDAAWQNDLKNGHITPQTYSSLFAKKDTLGKIGTVFGMLLSGAGSGLAHQPNALLGIMQNQINNDLDAQKNSKLNAQNFIRLNQQNELNKSQIALQVKQGKLTDQQAANLLQDAQIKATTNAHNQAMQAAFHGLVDKVTAMPHGPLRDRAVQQLGILYPMVQGIITNKIDEAAALTGYISQYAGSGQGNGQGGGTAAPSNVNYDRITQLEKQGQAKIPGGMNEQEVQAAGKEAANLEESRSIRADYIDSFNKLEDMKLAGKLSPNQRDAYVNALSAKLAKQSAGRYNLQEAHSLVDGMFPASTDIGKETGEVKLKKGLDYFDTIDAATPTLNRFHLKNPPPPVGGQSSQPNKQSQSSQAAAPQESVSKSGKPIIMKNGKWIYK